MSKDLVTFPRVHERKQSSLAKRVMQNLKDVVAQRWITVQGDCELAM